jgi:hypothetical protein
MENKYLTSADETVQLKYLLAKDDVDDINFACTIIAEKLKQGINKLQVSVLGNKITLLKKGSTKEYTFNIELDMETLYLDYLYSAPLHLFKTPYEIDDESLSAIKDIILSLGFKKEKERKSKAHDLVTKKESFKLEVTRRRRY